MLNIEWTLDSLNAQVKGYTSCLQSIFEILLSQKTYLFLLFGKTAWMQYWIKTSWPIWIRRPLTLVSIFTQKRRSQTAALFQWRAERSVWIAMMSTTDQVKWPPSMNSSPTPCLTPSGKYLILANARCFNKLDLFINPCELI